MAVTQVLTIAVMALLASSSLAKPSGGKDKKSDGKGWRFEWPPVKRGGKDKDCPKNSLCDTKGLKSDECLLSIWHSVGCTTDYPTGESRTDPEYAFWRSNTVEVITNDMTKYYDRARDGDDSYFEKCFGSETKCIGLNPCEGQSDAPLTKACLLHLWWKAGCKTLYPALLPETSWWGEHNITQVEAEMDDWKAASSKSPFFSNTCNGLLSGKCKSISKCFPVKEKHSSECLMDIWTGVGCTTDYPTDENPEDGWWTTNSLDTDAHDMFKWYRRSFPTDPKGKTMYSEACLNVDNFES